MEMEKLSCGDIIEIEQIKKLLKTKQQKEVFNWLVKIVDKSLNHKTTESPIELTTFDETSSEEDEELDLSDHSSDEDSS
tara:strand:- start:39 stop:275 length:237 start_codon:yes stop_codon:yes gene_type:complete